MRYAAYCGTRNIYSDMEAAARSLVANSAVDRVFSEMTWDEAMELHAITVGKHG